MKSIRVLAVAATLFCAAVPSRARSCRPWLVSSSLDRGGVSVSLTLGNACSPDNAGSYFMRYSTRDAAGQLEFAFRSADYPEQQAALDAALKSMALLGATDKDLEFLDKRVMPSAAAGLSREASEAWRGYLISRVL